jgi:glycosyltransferase involved in cell wall biosynthesis
MKDIKFELIFVNDGSKDKTLKILKDLSEKDKRVKYISFSRNFGKNLLC